MSANTRKAVGKKIWCVTFAALALFAGSGCSSADVEIGNETTGEEADKFIIWDDARDSLINQVRAGNTIGICLQGTGVTSSTRPTYEGYIRSAIMTWVNGARFYSDVSLVTTNNVVFGCSGADVTVNWSSSSGRAHAGFGFVNMFAGDDAKVVLHEFGHVFGLGDTYVEGVWNCQPGQENSVMCGNGGLFSSLQPDDRIGIQEVLCMTEPCLRNWAASLNWCWGSAGQLLTGDFNRDGRADLLCHRTTDGYKWIAYADRDGHYSGTGWEGNLGFCTESDQRLMLGDFNADGRMDMMCHRQSDGAKWIAHATTSGTFTGITWSNTNLFWCFGSDQQLLLGDFNRDGRTDMLCHQLSDGYKWIAYATASGDFSGTSWDAPMNWCNHSTGSLLVGDFNGDGRSDLMCHDTASGYKWIAYATSSGNFTGTNWEADLGWCSQPNDQLVLGDYNGDRRTDLLCHNTSSGFKSIAQADVNGRFSGTSRSWNMNWCNHSNGAFSVADTDGNGTSDFLCHDRVDGTKWTHRLGPLSRWECPPVPSGFVLGASGSGQSCGGATYVSNVSLTSSNSSTCSYSGQKFTSTCTGTSPPAAYSFSCARQTTDGRFTCPIPSGRTLSCDTNGSCVVL